MSVKPLVRWAMVQGYTLRYTRRTDSLAAGTLTTPDGEIAFEYDRAAQTLQLPQRQVQLNQHGWEINEAGKTVFTSRKSDYMPDDKRPKETDPDISAGDEPQKEHKSAPEKEPEPNSTRNDDAQ